MRVEYSKAIRVKANDHFGKLPVKIEILSVNSKYSE